MVQPLLLIVLAVTPTWSPWQILLPGTLAFAGIYILLPRPRLLPRRLAAVRILTGAILLLLGLALAGRLLFRPGGASSETVLFYTFSALAIVAGGLLVTQRHPVHAALSFALVVLSTCGLFL